MKDKIGIRQIGPPDTTLIENIINITPILAVTIIISILITVVFL